MKKITLFFALTLAAVGAAYSQNPVVKVDLTYSQFIQEGARNDGKIVHIYDAVLSASPQNTQGITCSTITTDEVVVVITGDKRKSPSTMCIKGDKNMIWKNTRNGRTTIRANVTLSGTLKDGYTISSLKFISGWKW